MPTGNKEKKKPWKHYRVGGGGGGGGGSQAEGGANYSHHSRQAPPTSNNKHVRHGAPFQSHHHKPIHTNSLKRTRDTEHTDYRAHQPRQQQQHNIATAPSASSSIPSPATLVPTNPSPPAREIPGFYYDTEKKKYFKITAVHLVKSQHPFSRDAIAEKTRQKPVLQPIVRSTKRYDTGAKGRDLSPYGHINWLLSDRQLGRAGPKHQLCEMHSMLVKRWKRNRDMDPIVTSGTTCTHMHVENTASGWTMYMGSSQGTLWCHTVVTDPETQHRGFLWRQIGFESGSEVTSLHKTTDNHIITTYLGNMDKPGCLKIQKEATSIHAMPTDALMYAPKKSNIWSSDYSGVRIALGADQKVMLINDWSSSAGQPCTETLWTGSDVFSVAIEPFGNNMIYAGCRNGSVRIYDLNQPRGTIPSNAAAFKKTQRQGSVFNGIGHKESSVNFLKRVSDHLLVTLAMNGEMSMWDTRFVGSSMFGGSVSASAGEDGGSEAKPVIQFRSPVQDQFSKSRFDITADGSLLVAENIENHLSVWSLRTGDRIHDLKLDGGPVGCMRFSDDQASGVYVAIADRIQYWGHDIV